MPDPVFTGVAAAIVTFFDEHGSVDAASTARHASHLAERGVNAIVVAGTTGEASHLSMKERLTLLDAVRTAVPAEVPVIIGTGALPPGVSSAELTKRSIDHGADAAVALSPHHGDVREYYEDIASAAGTFPVIAYHYPKVSMNDGISVDVLPLLPIAGLKDSTGDPTRMLEQLAVYDGPVYSGSAAMVLYAGALGCTGAILAAANLEPELAAKAFGGDVDAQRSLLDAHRIASFDSPHGLKRELHARYGTSPHCRHHHA
jgi:4-hydroxy-tetrahydrodipicolinate synthase